MNTERFAEQLRALRAELLERHERLDGHLHHRGGPVSADSEEQATERHDDDVVAALDDSVRDELLAIDAALARIESGRFGVCGLCGEAIENARLEAIPYATKCVGCKEAPPV
jgi:RNA polymerase-binding protein DksA